PGDRVFDATDARCAVHALDVKLEPLVRNCSRGRHCLTEHTPIGYLCKAIVSGPDRQLARRKYEQLAPAYDRLVRLTARMRRLAVERLELRQGDDVLDVGCGTGLSFPLIEERIGAEGRLIAVDLSPDML